MVLTPQRGYCNYIMFKDTSLLPHEILISFYSLGVKNFDSIIKSDKDLAIDFELDEIVESLLGEPPLRGGRAYLLTRIIIDISERDSRAVLFKPSKYRRKRAVFLNHCIQKIMISKEIRYENTIHDVVLDNERLCLTMR